MYQKRFKHALHREITKAIIKAIKNRVPNDYDDESTQSIIKGYFKRANEGVQTSLAFCPDDDDLIKIFETELESLKGL